MFFVPPGNFQKENWNSFGDGDHPQFGILKKHIDRAVQDLFLNSLRLQDESFICIFDSQDQIEKFTSKMIDYWEKEENYEVCAEILKLKKKMISQWEKSIKENNEGEDVKEWLRSSF